ncbi:MULTISPECIES: hypothetical protein [unclassified Sphingopyxis]|uniref:hypothetical protein n=1 Tax=unclassified Sphingopyxis TaxID=2614943 RepID=UPI0028664825|nr:MULTISPECIES: hypothetical protein [unclassified Sphingopyxis]MDR6832870.1 hypothetical protein [Sphingopyxis sp. BE122]MDR7228613.1 hypothetical protein [Sphingopyxis sp. BE259]
MTLINEFQQRQMRDSELRRFDRWFVDTAMGPAYRGRDGRARGVKAEEVARWRGEVEAHVDAMIAAIPFQAMWAVGALLAIVFGGGWLLDLLAIPQRFHAPAIGLGVFIVEVGMIGIEIWDYVAGWRTRRDGIEAAVAARAPLPIDPARLGSGHNWFQTIMLALVAMLILFAYAMHLDEGLLARTDRYWVFAAIPLAWGLHFAAKWYDRRLKSLRR